MRRKHHPAWFWATFGLAVAWVAASLFLSLTHRPAWGALALAAFWVSVAALHALRLES